MCYCEPEKEGARTWYQRPKRVEEPEQEPAPVVESEEEQGIPVDWPVPQKVENCGPYEPLPVPRKVEEPEQEPFEPLEPDPSDEEEVGVAVDWPTHAPALVPESAVVYIG